jgi:hypothetical protein
LEWKLYGVMLERWKYSLDVKIHQFVYTVGRGDGITSEVKSQANFFFARCIDVDNLYYN